MYMYIYVYVYIYHFYKVRFGLRVQRQIEKHHQICTKSTHFRKIHRAPFITYNALLSYFYCTPDI